MVIIRYTCQGCGLVVRAEEGQPHKACNCVEPQTEEIEQTEEGPQE